MAGAANLLENKIRAFLLEEGEKEIISGGFKVSLREDDQIEVKELPPLNLKQLELPLKQLKGGIHGGRKKHQDRYRQNPNGQGWNH
jgi:hypothetical protein